MAAARNYSSVARATTLTASVTNSATLFAVTDTTGFPATPFTMVVDPGRSTEEAVTVSATVGLNLTVLRGVDGTIAVPHDAGATIRHMATARDFREPGEHIGNTTGIHGVTSGLVALDDTQTIDNKTFLATGDHTPLKIKNSASQTTDVTQWQTTGGSVLASVKPTGRISTPGIDGTSSSTFTAGAAGTVPLIAKGAAAQTAHLLSARDAANIEMAYIGFDGTLTAKSTSVSGNLTVSAESDLHDLVVDHSTIATTDDVAVVPLTARVPAGQTAASFVVVDDTAVQKAGVRGSTGSYQLFHGADAANVVPFKIHTGTRNVVMTTGSSSIGATVDISAFGFTIAPHVQATVQQFEDSTLKRRVAVTFSSVSSSSVTFRVHQTVDQVMPDDTNYTIHYMLIQMLPSAANG